MPSEAETESSIKAIKINILTLSFRKVLFCVAVRRIREIRLFPVERELNIMTTLQTNKNKVFNYSVHKT
jgi:hypothetical protein